MRAFAPNGSPILGTLERLSERAEIAAGSFQKTPTGELDFEYSGGTEIFYDDQETVRMGGERLYLAEDGTEWKESSLVLLDVSEAWSGSPDPTDPDNFWIDDQTGERVNARTGDRSVAPSAPQSSEVR